MLYLSLFRCFLVVYRDQHLPNNEVVVVGAVFASGLLGGVVQLGLFEWLDDNRLFFFYFFFFVVVVVFLNLVIVIFYFYLFFVITLILISVVFFLFFR
jgi:hypothetical protein